MSSDPKNPWPACGPRNGLVGPLQGCGKPPGKVGSWQLGTGPGSVALPDLLPLGGSPSLGRGSCWVYSWSLGAGGLQALRAILQGSYDRAWGGIWVGVEGMDSEVFCTPRRRTASREGGRRCPQRTAWLSRCPPHISQVSRVRGQGWDLPRTPCLLYSFPVTEAGARLWVPSWGQAPGRHGGCTELKPSLPLGTRPASPTPTYPSKSRGAGGRTGRNDSLLGQEGPCPGGEPGLGQEAGRRRQRG